MALNQSQRRAATLKALVEHGQAGIYFRTLMGLGRVLRELEDLGWIEDDRKSVTASGQLAYREMKLSTLPKAMYGDATGWDWDKASLDT